MVVTAETFWTILLTAVLSACFASAGTYGIWLAQRSKTDQDTRNAARDAAYINLIRRILDFCMRARAYDDMLHFRSGLKEDAAVAAGQRKALDPAEFFPRLLEEFKPLNAAWSAVHVHGTQAGIDLADKVLEASGDLMIAATSTNDERSRLSRYALGERWTEKKSATYDEALGRLMRQRAALIRVARTEAGREAVIMAIDEASPSNE